MADNLQPVEIDIRMRQNISEESEKAARGMDAVSHSADKLEKSITYQKAIIKDLEKQYREVSRELSNMSLYSSNKDPRFAAARDDAEKLLKEVKTGLDEEKKSLERLEAEYKKASGAREDLNNKQTTAITRMRNIREEMISLDQAGQREGERYRELSAELEKLGTSYRTVAQEQKQLSTGGSTAAGVISGLTGIAGAASAAQGVMSLFVKDNERLAEIQTKLQAAMAITIGLQQVSSTLHQTSTFRINVVDKVTRTYTSTLNKLTIAFKGSELAAKAAMGAMTLGLSIAIGAAIVLWDKYKKKQDQIAEEKILAAEEEIEANKKIAGSVSTSLASLTKLQKQWLLLADDIKSKNKFIEENRKEFENLGVSVNNVNDAENVLVTNSKAVITALKLRAQAIAAQDKAIEQYKKSIETQIYADQIQIEEFNPNDDEITAKRKEFVNGINKSLKEGFQEGANQTKKAGDEYIDMYLKILERADKELEDAGINPFSQTSKGKSSDTSLEQAKKDLLKRIQTYQDNINSAQIALMQEGAEKQRQVALAEFEKTKRQIQQEYTELAAIEKITGKSTTEQRSLLGEWETVALNQYEAKLKEIEQVATESLSAIFNDVNSRFQSQLDNELEQINHYYKNIIKGAKEAGASEEMIRELTLAKALEIELAKQDAQLRTLEFEKEIALRRMAISGRFYLFESDRIRETTEFEKKALKERLKVLKEQYSKMPTSELAEEIESVTVSIEEMEAKLKKLNVQKFTEIAGYIGQVSSGLKDLFGEDDIAKVIEWTEGLANAAVDLTKGIMSGDPTSIINGALKATSVIKDIFKTNKEAEKEIKEFYRELEVIATRYAIAVINTIKDITGATDSLFSNDISNSLTKSMEGYNAAIEKERDLISQLGDTTVQVGKKKKKFIGITYGTKTLWEDILTGYRKVLNTDEDLIDSSGQLNREIAEALLNSGKLSKEAEDLIGNILDAQDAATDAMLQFEDVLSGIAGTIGDDLRNALVDAFKSGDLTSAADSFGRSTAAILEDWISQVAFSSVFGEMLSELESKMKNSFNNGDQDITDDIAWFMQNYTQGVDEYMSALDEWKKQLRELYDIDIFSDDEERKGASKGIASISQDSANELNGNFYALRQQVGDIRNMQKEANQTRSAMQQQLQRILENTEYLRYLYDIKTGVDDMQQRGIKVKV